MSLKKTNSGVALLMVMTTITILSFVLGDFLFRTQSNKLKVYNIQDNAQARLNAEAGLQFARAKLKIYQEAYNVLQTNQNAQSFLSLSQLESIITQPFIFPIPELPNFTIAQKMALEEFQKNSLIRGEISVSLRPISGFLNINAMRNLVTLEADSNNQDNENDDEPAHSFMEKQILEALTVAYNNKRDNDEEFAALYSDQNLALLIKEIKYFISAEGTFNDPEGPTIMNRFDEKGISPKFAPMSSISEMNLLPSWDDTLIDLIKDKISFTDIGIIPLNNLTDQQLKVIFPAILDEQIDAFFEYRDGVSSDPEKSADLSPHPFQNTEQFKTLIVSQLKVVGEDAYNKRIEELKKYGLELAVASKFFLVEANGSFERSSFKIQAWIDMPIQEQKAETPNTEAEEDSNNQSEGQNENQGQTTGQTRTSSTQRQNSKTTLQLLSPRIVEIRMK